MISTLPFWGEGWGDDSNMIAFAAAFFFANTGIDFRWELNAYLDLHAKSHLKNKRFGRFGITNPTV